MNITRQIIKLVITPEKLTAVCINNKGNTIAIDLNLTKKEDAKKIVDDFAGKLLNILDKEIG